VGNYDSYDLRQNSSALFPPEYYVDYLHNEYVMKQIGAQVIYEECQSDDLFTNTGEVSVFSTSFY
jgi:hypothetical protein